MGFGERVLQALDAKNMTREELYSATGLKSSYLVGYIKNPNRSPQLSTACKIALALDVSLDYLGGLIDEPRPIQRDERGRPVFPDALSDSEVRLVDAYRSTDARGRGTIMRTAEGEAGMEGQSETGVMERGA